MNSVPRHHCGFAQRAAAHSPHQTPMTFKKFIHEKISNHSSSSARRCELCLCSGRRSIDGFTNSSHG
jgi:hypothetical protein